MKNIFHAIKTFVFNKKNIMTLGKNGFTNESIIYILGGLIKIKHKKMNINQSGITMYNGNLFCSCLPNDKIV